MDSNQNSSSDHAPRLEESTAADGQRELVLVKNGHRYVFRCDRGREPELINRFKDMAKDPNVDLTSFDAAMLSHQLTQDLKNDLYQLKR